MSWLKANWLYRLNAAFTVLLLSTSAFSQSISDANIRSEVAKLRVELQGLQLRLERLEATFPEKTGTNSVFPQVAHLWHEPENWKRIKQGMSRAQVEGILGKATKVKGDAASYTTLIYSGDRRGSGEISGNVVLDNNNRALGSGINVPVF
jgi:hypothetical protein